MNWDLIKLNLFLRAYTLTKIPLVSAVAPRAFYKDEHKLILRVPFKRFNRNHLGVMYFGALAVGAEVAVALAAVEKIVLSRQPVDYIFKDFKAQFLKRAEGDVHFHFEHIQDIVALVEKAIASGEREEITMPVWGEVPTKNPGVAILKAEITLSVKRKK